LRFPEKALCSYLGHGKGPIQNPNKGHATAAPILSTRPGGRFKREASRDEAGTGISLRHPFGAGKMALEGSPRSIRFAVRLDV
jgi:hypothetical protein